MLIPVGVQGLHPYIINNFTKSYLQNFQNKDHE
jgi:hypothetical protein